MSLRKLELVSSTFATSKSAHQIVSVKWFQILYSQCGVGSADRPSKVGRNVINGGVINVFKIKRLIHIVVETFAVHRY